MNNTCTTLQHYREWIFIWVSSCKAILNRQERQRQIINSLNFSFLTCKQVDTTRWFGFYFVNNVCVCVYWTHNNAIMNQVSETNKKKQLWNVIMVSMRWLKLVMAKVLDARASIIVSQHIAMDVRKEKFKNVFFFINENMPCDDR